MRARRRERPGADLRGRSRPRARRGLPGTGDRVFATARLHGGWRSGQRPPAILCSLATDCARSAGGPQGRRPVRIVADTLACRRSRPARLRGRVVRALRGRGADRHRARTAPASRRCSPILAGRLRAAVGTVAVSGMGRGARLPGVRPLRRAPRRPEGRRSRRRRTSPSRKLLLGDAGARAARRPGGARPGSRRRRCRSPGCRPASAGGVALARLLVARRPLWLLDEPTAALDRRAQEAVTALIARPSGGGWARDRGDAPAARARGAAGTAARVLRMTRGLSSP